MKRSLAGPLLALLPAMLLAMPLHGRAQTQESTMYLNENYAASEAGSAAYALRTPPVRDDRLGAWHVLLEFAGQPGRVAMETWATDLDLSQAKYGLRQGLERQLAPDGRQVRERLWRDEQPAG